MISDISVTVTPYLQPNIGLDPSRVCLIVESTTAAISAFKVNKNSYSEDVSAKVTDATDSAAVLAACQLFFSEQNGKNYAIIAVVTESDLSPLTIADESLQYGFAVLTGARKDFSAFENLLTAVSGQGAFLVVNDASSPVPTDTGQARLIQFVHPSNIALQATSFLAAQLDADPGYNCAHNITNSAISDDTYSAGLRNQLLAAGCNLYFTVDGIRKIKNGTVNDKTKIERKYFGLNYLPYFIRTQIAQWRESVAVKESSIATIRAFVESLFNSLASRGLLKNSELLGNVPYVIDNISIAPVDSILTANVSLRYSFNGNIDAFNFSIREVA